MPYSPHALFSLCHFFLLCFPKAVDDPLPLVTVYENQPGSSWNHTAPVTADTAAEAHFLECPCSQRE